MKRLILFALVICVGLLSNSKFYAQQTTPPNSKNTQADVNKLNATLLGNVVWKGKDLTQTNVSVYRDEKLKDLYTSGLTNAGSGDFTLRVEPGKYYLVAYVDIDKSGKFDEGDGYGVMGITKWENKEQKHQSVEIAEKAKKEGLQIQITARLQRIGEELRLVSTSLYKPSEYKKFQSDLTLATSGCRGIVKYTEAPSQEKVRTLILAYTDTSWKFRAGITVVDPNTNTWELRLKPGKYYIMAVVDKNSNDKLDAGDKYGFYGVSEMKKGRSFPIPVLVKSNVFTLHIDIPITATYATTPKPESRENSAIIKGRVEPLPDKATNVQVEVYATSALVRPIATAKADSQGKYIIQLPPGDYYLVANHDADGDGRYSEGDALGALGTSTIVTNPPPAVVFHAGETRAVNIQLSARYDADGQLVPMKDTENSLPVSDIGPSPIGSEPTDKQMGRITGRITSFLSTSTIQKESNPTDGENQEPIPTGLLSLSTTQEFDDPMYMPLFLDENGTFIVDVKPGKYYVMAVVDHNSDGKSGIKDGIGIYGTHQPVRGTPAAINVYAGKITPHVDIDILASYVDEEGTMAELSDGGKWNIARMYGQPEDIFKYTQNGKLIEEWMYWTRGVGFYFEAEGAGWKLTKREKFNQNKENVNPVTPNNDKQVSEETPNPEVLSHRSANGFSLASESVFVYYSHDGVLWRIAPSTAKDFSLNANRNVPIDTRVAPLDAGFRPSASANGLLVYHDFDDNIILKDIASGKSRIFLDKRELIEDVTISPDGEYLAYSHAEPTGRKRIIIQHLRSKDTFRVPSTAVEMSNPAWSKNGRLLAYATAGSIENRESGTSRNIYGFDTKSNSVEPIVVSPADDAEPAWHPDDKNTLAFSRSIDEDTRQIWIVSYSNTGKPTEKQVTEMGGSRPVWVPSNGRWILYENNGQLWTVDVLDTGSEAPLLSNGKAVFGYQPVAVSFD